MNTNLLVISQEIDSLEAELNALLHLQDIHPSSPDLIKASIKNITNRVGVISYSILNIENLYKKVSLDGKEEIEVKELISKFMSLVLSKLLLKLVLINTGKTEASILLLDCLNNRKSGIIPEVTKYIQIIDKVIKDRGE
jgi:hypothetical protein